MGEESKPEVSEVKKPEVKKVVKQSLEDAELEWVQLNQQLSRLKKNDDSNENVETPKEKLLRKCIENPFVPIGTVATAGFLFVGLTKFVRNDTHGSQKMMRGRIAAQGFTILAIAFGFGLSIREKLKKEMAAKAKTE